MQQRRDRGCSQGGTMAQDACFTFGTDDDAIIWCIKMQPRDQHLSSWMEKYCQSCHWFFWDGRSAYAVQSLLYRCRPLWQQPSGSQGSNHCLASDAVLEVSRRVISALQHNIFHQVLNEHHCIVRLPHSTIDFYLIFISNWQSYTTAAGRTGKIILGRTVFNAKPPLRFSRNVLCRHATSRRGRASGRLGPIV